MDSTDSHQSFPTSDPPPQNRTGSSQVVTIVLTLWVVAVSFAAQAGGWLVEQIFIFSGSRWPVWGHPAILVGQSALLFGTLGWFAWLWKVPRYRAIFQTWTVAAIFPLIIIPVRMIALPVVQRHIIPQILITLVYGIGVLGLIWLGERKQRQSLRASFPPITGQGILAAILLAPLLALPWLAWGTLGSPADTLLNLLAELLFGLVTSLILSYFLLRPLRSTSSGAGWDIVLGGFTGGTTLLLLASGLSFNGMQLLLMLVLPATGWLLMSLSRLGNPAVSETNWPSLALLIGLTAAAPVMWFDPDEFVLILSLSSGEILGWAISAALVTLLIGWSLGLIFFLAGQRLAARLPWPVWLSGIAVTWLAGGIVYFHLGQPGFYGDALFVILKDQADLSAAANLDDIDARRRFVYQTLVDHANATQGNLRAGLKQRNIPYQPFYLVNAIEVEGGPLLRRWLAAQPEVDRVLFNPVLRPLPEPVSPVRGTAGAPTEPEWNLTSIGADRVWETFGVTGEGIVIGQSDSGVDWQHPDLRPTYRGQGGRHDYNWLDPWNASPEPVDVGGHGTHTLGSIVGQTTGVAPGATWYACANLPRNLANPALYLDCMQFMLAPSPPNGDPFSDGDPSLSADVLNNSWGCPDLEGCDPDALLAGVQALRAAGIFVVASAGNDGPGCESIQDPLAIYDDAFSVGAMDAAGELAFFSSRGPVTVDGSERLKPDIIAPGVNILSTYPGGTYAYADGTSMAGPHVVGVVALVWSANPNLIGQIEQTEEILRQTARPFSGELPNCGDIQNAVGNGIINAYAAVQMALSQIK